MKMENKSCSRETFCSDGKSEMQLEGKKFLLVVHQFAKTLLHPLAHLIPKTIKEVGRANTDIKSEQNEVKK